jgi:hypothetical protein
MFNVSRDVGAVPVLHSVKYLVNTVGDVITSQQKAWNDQVRMAMYAELVIVPLKVDGKILIWADNAKLHKTPAMTELFTKLNIMFSWYPPNCTHILQVLQLFSITSCS